MNRTDRLHAIGEALRRAGPSGITASRLSEDFEVSVRTIKRDMSALQQIGLPLWSRSGPGGGYVLDASASLPPVAFTPSQAVAVAMALTVLPPASPFSADVRSAAGKVLDTLDQAARTRAEALGKRVWVLPERTVRTPSPAAVRAIERALVEHAVLSIRYRSADDRLSKRAVEPIIVAWRDGQWYLVAHCRMREGLRWFRFDRIERADTTGDRYEPRPLSSVGTPPRRARPVS